MKKIVIISMLFSLVCPMFAAQITFTAKNNGDGTFTIGYYTDDPQVQIGPTCIGLQIEVNPENDKIESLDGMDSFFNIFMSAAYMEIWHDGYDYGEVGRGPATYHPDYITHAYQVKYPLTIEGWGDMHFGLSLCGLGGDSDAPVLENSPISTDSANPVVVAVLHCSTATSGTIGLNELVGGVVDKDGFMTTNLDAGAVIPFVITNGLGAPDCWHYAGQCHADADGNGIVEFEDWPAFRDSFARNYWDHYPGDGVTPQAGDYNPCGDYNHDGVVNTSDWPKFRDNFEKSVSGCPNPTAWPPVAP